MTSTAVTAAPSVVGRGRRALQDVALPVGLVLVLGVVAGLVWWRLAPTGAVVQGPGYLAPIPSGGRETPGDVWSASQDSVYAAVVVVGGSLGGLVATVRAGRGTRMLVRWVSTVVAGLAASVIAWQAGVLLGPSTIADQQAAGADPLVSPLGLSSPAPLLLWSASTCAVVFVLVLVSMLVHPPGDGTDERF